MNGPPQEQRPPLELQYATPADSRRHVVRRAAKVLLAAWAILLGLAVVGSFLPHRAGPQALTIKCANNLRLIGTAIQMYATEHQGNFPDRWETLLQAMGSELEPGTFLCPADDGVLRTGTNRNEKIARLAHLDHCSYFYVARQAVGDFEPLRNTIFTDRVLAIELPGHHPNGAINVLLSDGIVMTLNKDDARKLLGLIATGTRPIIWPPPSTQPTGP